MNAHDKLKYPYYAVSMTLTEMKKECELSGDRVLCKGPSLFLMQGATKRRTNEWLFNWLSGEMGFE